VPCRWYVPARPATVETVRRSPTQSSTRAVRPPGRGVGARIGRAPDSLGVGWGEAKARHLWSGGLGNPSVVGYLDRLRSCTYNVRTEVRRMTDITTRTTRGSETKSARFQLRASREEDQLIRQAAASTGETLSSFVLLGAMTRARRVLSDRRRFVLDEKDWSIFSEALERPATVKPQLRELLARPSVLDD